MRNDESPLILIVDDTPHNLQVAGEILSRENYRIALAQSGGDAMKFLEKRKPDLILLDIMMPEIDGFRVCEYLKENLETKFIPVIFLTARAQIEDIIKGFELGGADYLTKPFNDRELVARVRAQLELVKLQDMLRTKNRKLLEEIRLRKQREQDLVDYEKGRYVSVLVGGIAHEFNNLLQVILGYGELVGESLKKGSEESELQNSVLEAGKKAAKMVEQLMFFADRRPGKSLDKIDLVKFLEDRISLFRGVFPEDIDFRFEIPDRPMTIIADKSELAQAMVNLFLNACEAVDNQGQIDVRLSGYVTDSNFQQAFKVQPGVQMAMIEVRDNGRGMSADLIKKVFDPFVTYRKENGVGLGLSVVKAVIGRLGGHVELASEIEKGTACRLYIPLANGTSSVSRFYTASRDYEGSCGNGELILLAEDEENVAFLEKKILEKEGYRVIAARDGEEAVELFKKHQDEIKIVLLDIGMPIKNGIEAGREIESISCEIPIVYCTAYTDKSFEEIADKALILQKPFKRNEIVGLISETIKEN